ncbi:hypothetical protein BLNAU_4543 [Blattamonas nauphoetae]|uniref:C2H2-type domain-containing protein n=1 Tax=Blattamonas nauphoetae TaxID=2049346 RepID=A0ABQ9Y966_9EUKA|nr:hypothetical protein BLNAU_4543 [Blattamonas nauphoetae]
MEQESSQLINHDDAVSCPFCLVTLSPSHLSSHLLFSCDVFRLNQPIHKLYCPICASMGIQREMPHKNILIHTKLHTALYINRDILIDEELLFFLKMHNDFILSDTISSLTDCYIPDQQPSPLNRSLYEHKSYPLSPSQLTIPPPPSIRLSSPGRQQLCDRVHTTHDSPQFLESAPFLNSPSHQCPKQTETADVACQTHNKSTFRRILRIIVSQFSSNTPIDPYLFRT